MTWGGGENREKKIEGPSPRKKNVPPPREGPPEIFFLISPTPNHKCFLLIKWNILSIK